MQLTSKQSGMTYSSDDVVNYSEIQGQECKDIIQNNADSSKEEEYSLILIFCILHHTWWWVEGIGLGNVNDSHPPTLIF